MKKRSKALYFFCLVFLISLIIGCSTYKTNPLGYNGELIFRHSAKIIKNRTKFIETDFGIDTVYTGFIKASNGLKSPAQYKYKTRIKKGEKGRFYLIEFTDLTSGKIDGIWYDINYNQVLYNVGPAIIMKAKYSGKGFTRELLAEIFFVWLNKDYYNK